MATKAYTVLSAGVSEKTVEQVAESIEELAHSIRSHASDPHRTAMNADSIMHLAADIKFDAEDRAEAHRAAAR